jgi:MFS family permease
VVVLGVRERGRAQAADGSAAARPASTPLDPRFKRFLVVIVLFTLGNSSDAFLVLRAQTAGASVLGVLALLALFNLVYSLVATPLGVLSDRLDRRRLIAAGWLLYAAVYLGFGLVGVEQHALLALAGLWVMYGVYYGLTEGVAKALVADVVRPEARGTAYGFYNAAVGLTLLPASVLAGVLWQGLGAWAGFGPAAPFVFGSALALVAAGLLVKWV